MAMAASDRATEALARAGGRSRRAEEKALSRMSRRAVGGGLSVRVTNSSRAASGGPP